MFDNKGSAVRGEETEPPDVLAAPFFCMAHTPVTVVKADEARQLVFGWASVALSVTGDLITDTHGDQIDPQDLEDAAYEFVLLFRDMNERHEQEVKGQLVESFVVTPDKLEKMGLPPDSLPIGWWTGFYVADPAVFQKVRDGEYTMFSIEGVAQRVPVE